MKSACIVALALFASASPVEPEHLCDAAVPKLELSSSHALSSALSLSSSFPPGRLSDQVETTGSATSSYTNDPTHSMKVDTSPTIATESRALNTGWQATSSLTSPDSDTTSTKPFKSHSTTSLPFAISPILATLSSATSYRSTASPDPTSTSPIGNSSLIQTNSTARSASTSAIMASTLTTAKPSSDEPSSLTEVTASSNGTALSNMGSNIPSSRSSERLTTSTNASIIASKSSVSSTITSTCSASSSSIPGITLSTTPYSTSSPSSTTSSASSTFLESSRSAFATMDTASSISDNSIITGSSLAPTNSATVITVSNNSISSAIASSTPSNGTFTSTSLDISTTNSVSVTSTAYSLTSTVDISASSSSETSTPSITDSPPSTDSATATSPPDTSTFTSSSSTTTTGSTISATPTHGSTFYIQASDVMREYTDPDTGSVSQDDNLFRSNGKYAVIYPIPRSHLLTFGASSISDATPFRLNTQSRPYPPLQDDLISVDFGLTLNTFYRDRSATAYFDEDPIGGGWYPPACEITGSILTCSLNTQNQFSICFGSSDPDAVSPNGSLYLTANPIGQGRQCRSVTANIVWQ